jgi:predicted short-subunit dehydrogenase-like oxidoreductase (DUF2520 family)
MKFLLSASGWYSCKLETVPTPFRYLRQERKSTASPSGKAGDTMKIGFIGAGKVGFSLGKFFTQGGIRLTGYYSRRPESAREAASFTGAKAYDSPDDLVKESDAIFLTVPDGSISSVYLSLEKSLIPGKMICHCSGSMTVAEAFPGISQTGAYGYSIHPLFPVSNRLTSYRELPGAFFCLEGNGPHLSMWQELLESLGASAQIISGESKVRITRPALFPAIWSAVWCRKAWTCWRPAVFPVSRRYGPSPHCCGAIWNTLLNPIPSAR